MLLVINFTVITALLFVSIYTILYIRKSKILANQMNTHLKYITKQFNCEHILTETNTTQQHYRLLVELVDPLALAKRESDMAKIFSEIAPNFVTKEVYRQAKKQAILDLQQRNVEGHVSIITI
ncbi:MAG: hypothetical protein HQK77_07000 [Desulfobacterales bacterium]|nr:hypothetical protein [Desulfobacterales bacterium]